MSDDPYQRILEALAYSGSAAPAPPEMPRTLEGQQRLHNEHLLAARHRRERDREIEAAQARANDVLVERERERDRRLQQYALEEKAAFRDTHVQAILDAGGSVQDAERTLTAAWDEELLRRASLRRSNSHATGAI